MQDNANSSVPTSKRHVFIMDLLAFSLILSAPYLNFVAHQDFLYEPLNVVVIACFTVIALVPAAILWPVPSPVLRAIFSAILLLIFIDFQFDWIQWWGKTVAATAAALFLISWVLHRHLSLILVAVFGTTIIGVLGTSIAGALFQGDSGENQTVSGANPNLPVYVHLILDEHAGIESFDETIPGQKAIKDELLAFYGDHNFRIFGRAYSPFLDTQDALASTLNFQTNDRTDSLYSVDPDGKKYKFLHNVYFEKLLSLGYKINVYQTDYLDLCAPIKNRIEKCHTFSYYETSSTALHGQSINDKANIVISTYIGLSIFVSQSLSAFQYLLPYLSKIGLGLPVWMESQKTIMSRVGPIPVLPIFDKLIEDVLSSAGGTVFFAHLLIPHSPNSVDSACQIRRPVSVWKNIELIRDKERLTPEQRLAYYGDYANQIRCALSKIGKLFDALKSRGTFEDAIIIVQGDHGSRIFLNKPVIENRSRLSRQDYYDAFSTLYAVKSPDIPPGHDARMMALPDLLRNTVMGGLEAPDAFDEEVERFVYLRGRRDGGYIEVPMPNLPMAGPR